jgi:hypothetical protein
MYTLTKNTHVKTHMWNTCGSHVELEQSHMIHMWVFTCVSVHMWFTCESYVNYMWLFQFHMWTTCVFFIRAVEWV